jgi:hypothetical protein
MQSMYHQQGVMMRVLQDNRLRQEQQHEALLHQVEELARQVRALQVHSHALHLGAELPASHPPSPAAGQSPMLH